MSANIAASRIKREFKEVIRSEEVAKCAIRVELVNDNFTELRGEISGPPDTPYEGGTFKLEIKIPETYPFNPPKVSIGRSLIVYNNSLTIKIVSLFITILNYFQ
ncbi:unnamed protein product [Bemisia tabaci]|uniref:UBC core domain-containing protein n=1 Tax=Bemisia tabaci TaxID=7038 RepID=A0AAI8Y617_BEMTA|nr:unnamed protein product [Bemisia tabaci]